MLCSCSSAGIMAELELTLHTYSTPPAGKSSVGKSSTVNSLLGEPAMRVQAFKLQPDAETCTAIVKEASVSTVLHKVSFSCCVVLHLLPGMACCLSCLCTGPPYACSAAPPHRVRCINASMN